MTRINFGDNGRMSLMNPEWNKKDYMKINKTKSRHIRIFISSTFRDMHAERDYLIKYTFPELRKRCRERELELTEVDLRWGVTQEQAENGEVLPICLKEIENSRPYFIGLLGERYGWVPPKDHIHPSILEREKWIEEHLDKSVTEMEILHGVLNNPEMTDKAFFYFRDPLFIEDVDEKEKSVFKENDPELQNKLNELKKKIKESGSNVEEQYRTPEELGKYIIEDLWKSIDADYPESEIPDPLEKEAMEHEQFAESRRRVYIGRQEYFDRLDAHANSSDAPLIIKGESGSGKTALVANWVDRYRKKNLKVFIIQHYVGSSVQSTDHLNIMIRIMKELKRNFSLRQDIPTDANKIKIDFPNWLHMAAAKGKVILVLDGINQLEDKDNAHALYWLPDNLPKEIRLLVSVLPGEMDKVLEQKKWLGYSVKGLRTQERKQLIGEYLGLFTKKLDDQQIELLMNAEQTKNPVFLKVLLDELRVFGVYEELNQRINHYLTAQKPDDLYELILERIEQDYEQQHPGLVKNALSYIYASRYGLTENELLDLLGDGKNPLPQIFWSPVYLALEEALVSRNGLLNFYHDYMRKSVYNRYIQNPENKKKLHKSLGDYFSLCELIDRKVDELPWQYKHAEATENLYVQIKNIEFIQKLIYKNELEAYEYWAYIIDNSDFSPTEAYSNLIEKPGQYLIRKILSIYRILERIGKYEDCLKIMIVLDEAYAKIDDFEFYSDLILEGANLLTFMNKYNEALNILQKLESRYEEKEKDETYYLCLLNQAALFWRKKENEKAEYIVKNVIDYAEGNNDEQILMNSYFLMANSYSINNQYDDALKMYKKQEYYCKKLNDQDALLACLLNQGRNIQLLGNYDEAIEFFNGLEDYCRKILNYPFLHKCLGYEAQNRIYKGDFKEGINLLTEKESICKRLNDNEGLKITYSYFGKLYDTDNKPQDAIKYYRKEEEYARKIGRLKDVTESLSNQACIYFKIQNYDQANKLYDRYEAICKEFNDENQVNYAWLGRAAILYDLKKYDESLEIYKQLIQIFYSSMDSIGLRKTFNNMIYCLDLKSENAFDKGDLDQYYNIQVEIEEMSYKIKDYNSIQLSLSKQANYFKHKKQPEEALRLFAKKEVICAEHDIKSGEIFAVQKQSFILWNLNKLEEAYQKVCTWENLAKEYKNDDLSKCLNLKGVLLMNLKREDEALEIFEKLKIIAKQTGDEINYKNALTNSIISFIRLDKPNKVLDTYKVLKRYYELSENRTSYYQQENKTIKSILDYALKKYDSGQYDDSLLLYNEFEVDCNINKDYPTLRYVLGNIGLIYNNQKSGDKAFEYYKAQEEICHKTKNNYSLCICLNNQSMYFRNKGDYKSALAKLLEAEQFFEKSFFPNFLILVANIADMNYRITDYKKAKYYCDMYESIAKETNSQLDNYFLTIKNNVEVKL